MLFVHLFPSVVSDTRCSRIAESEEANVVEFQFADSHLKNSLEGNFVGNRRKQPRSDVVEGSRVPEVCLVQCLHEKSRRTLQTFLQSSGGRNSETTWLNFVLYIFFLHCGLDSPPVVWS